MKMQGTLLLLSLATQAFAASCTSYDIQVASQGATLIDVDFTLAIAHSPDFKLYEIRTAASQIVRKLSDQDFDQDFEALLNENDQICGWAQSTEDVISLTGEMNWSDDLETETLSVESESTSGCSCRNMVWTVVFVTHLDYQVTEQFDEAETPALIERRVLLSLPSKDVSTTKTTTFSRVYDGFEGLEMMHFANAQDVDEFIVVFHSGYNDYTLLEGYDEINVDALPAMGSQSNIPRVTFTPTESASVGLTSWWSLFSHWF